MSLLAMPFVGTGADTALHTVSFVFAVGLVIACAFGFWKIHELPITKAHKNKNHQMELVVILTWIGFIWHWVWIIAVVIAYIDGEALLKKIYHTWHDSKSRIIKKETKE